MTPADIAHLKQVRDSIESLVETYFPSTSPRILGKPYLAPLFWIAAPTSKVALPNSSSHLGYGAEDVANRLSVRLLGAGDVSDCVISWGVLCGQFLTLRRVTPGQADGSSQPSYLMLPARPRVPEDSLQVSSGCGHDLNDALERQENAAADLIINLTRLELYGTEELFDIATDLEISHNHLKAYDRAVDEADTLWDRLATHLLLYPSNTGGLEKTHQAIQLLHQTLLQAVADVNLTARLVDDCVGRVEAASAHLVDKFNAKITATHPTDDDSLHEALTSSGNFRTVRKHADQVAKTARRVRGHYSDVMTAISQAFDERRVREGDKVQKAGTMLSAAFTAIAFVTILDVVVNWKYNVADASDVHPIVRIVLTVLSSLAGVVVLYFIIDFWRRVRAKPLGGKKYADSYYPLVWNYLRRSSTDMLDRYKNHVQDVEVNVKLDCTPGEHATLGARLGAAERLQVQREEQCAELWNKLDQDLASELASVWDTVCKYRNDVLEDRDGTKGRWKDIPAFKATSDGSVHTDNEKQLCDDLTALQKQVESWSLQALILTERPRALWPYELPLLTCMYCALGVPDWAVKPHHEDGNFRAVADVDFEFVFRGGPGLLVPETEALRHWLDKQRDEQRVGTDLNSLRELLEKKGVRVGMDAGVLKNLGVNVGTSVP